MFRSLLCDSKEEKKIKVRKVSNWTVAPEANFRFSGTAQGMLPPTAEMSRARCLIMNWVQRGASETEPQANTRSVSQSAAMSLNPAAFRLTDGQWGRPIQRGGGMQQGWNEILNGVVCYIRNIYPPAPPSLALQDWVTLKKNRLVLGGFRKWCNTNNLIPPKLDHHIYDKHSFSSLFPFSTIAASCFAPLLASITGGEPPGKRRQINHPSRMWDITAGQKQKDKVASLANRGKGQGEALRRRTGERSTGTG